MNKKIKFDEELFESILEDLKIDILRAAGGHKQRAETIPLKDLPQFCSRFLKGMSSLLSELEDLCGDSEEGDLKYEARAVAKLSDIPHMNPSENLTLKQIKLYCDSIRCLLNNWGNLNREKMMKITSILVDGGISLLPTTDACQKDIEKAAIIVFGKKS